ncbi:hypothetical protein V8G54_029938 [Vigna mungo]|uniref:Uncharacterized protein n=1 Tax=Vigna mungo TaxID=3915 RepID=A0AAQ3MUQ0_VIGMU
MTFNYCHVTKSNSSWQPLYHPKIRVLHLGEIFICLHREKKKNATRDFPSMEDDFTNYAAHGSMKKTNLVVGEDDDPGALHNGDKDYCADDEALNLDDSWLMRENEDSMEFEIRVRDLGEIATLMVVAMEVALDGVTSRRHGDFGRSLWRRWRFSGLKVEEDGDVVIVKCHLNTVAHTWTLRTPGLSVVNDLNDVYKKDQIE